MSRHLFAFLLSELRVVRVKCPRCSAVTEMSVEQLGHRLDGADPKCPVCRADWPEFIGNMKNHLTQLGKTIHEFQQTAGAKHVEFVLPDAEGKK